jgi:hypothetical protein
MGTGGGRGAGSPAERGDGRSRSGFFKASHVGPRIAEQEDLDSDVIVDVALREEGPDLASRRLLYHARELLRHPPLKAPTDLLDRRLVAVLGRAHSVARRIQRFPREERRLTAL